MDRCYSTSAWIHLIYQPRSEVVMAGLSEIGDYQSGLKSWSFSGEQGSDGPEAMGHPLPSPSSTVLDPFGLFNSTSADSSGRTYCRLIGLTNQCCRRGHTRLAAFGTS